MSNILTLSFWFDVYPLPFNEAAYYIIGLVLLLGVFLGVVGKILKSKGQVGLIRTVWAKLTNFGFSFGIIGLVLVFLKQQRAPYLGMRLWLILWLAICFVWLLFILKYIFLEIPRIKQANKQRAEFDKYLPK
ncbi:MAG TPA: hypothetical protein VJK25_03100 [Patescibacteria group bacterium]|nr:hypothetical protein [Patescibacteria group bacterium]